MIRLVIPIAVLSVSVQTWVLHLLVLLNTALQILQNNLINIAEALTLYNVTYLPDKTLRQPLYCNFGSKESQLKSF